MKKYLIAAIIVLLNMAACSAQYQPQIPMDSKIEIKEAMTIAEQFGDKIWKGYNEVPFTILLVTDSVGFLINYPHADPGNNFHFLKQDTMLHSKIYYRKRQFSKHFLATFPAINGVNCIVAGTPENTKRSSMAWIITLLHEHFHQYEYASPGYYASVKQLGLAGEDSTGMWMLNYSFPYDSTIVDDRYQKYAAALSTILANINTQEFKSDFKKYKQTRKEFENTLSTLDYRYFSFQIWQEGIARYTEYKFLDLLRNYHPSQAVIRLPDFISYNKYRKEFYKKQIYRLNNFQLKKEKRVCFYAIGFAEGLLLDKLNPGWHKEFLKDKFYIEDYSTKG